MLFYVQFDTLLTLLKLYAIDKSSTSSVILLFRGKIPV